LPDFILISPEINLDNRLINKLFIFLILIPCFTSAFNVTGRIADSKGEELPFVNIYVKNTGKSTTSNSNGYYSLELPTGTYTVVFKMIGYKALEKEMNVGTQPMVMDIMLKEETYNLNEVVINADAEDPAYAVIRNAIKKRKFYLNQVDAFSCDVYIKGLQRVTKFPKKIMGMEIDPEGEIDTVTGIVYLSESVSKFNFKQPDKVKEIMVSSKVSGNNKAFSYNKASEMFFNFYENILEVEALSDRGFISPINANAMLYYKYKLLGTFYENDMLINKIQVIPRRKADACFQGNIYIIENSWRIHSTELMLTKDAQIDFVDTLLIEQIHFPVDKDTWLVLSNKFSFVFGFLAIKGNGNFIGVNSNYVLNPDFPKKYFTNEEWKVEDDANKKDSAYWKDTRPLPLTPEEIKDYRKRDSLELIKNSKPYLDSIDRNTNKLKIGKILFTGYTYTQRYKKRTWNFSPLIMNASFNTVRGWVGGLTVSREQELERNRRYDIGLSGSYGFSDETVNGVLFFHYMYNRVRFARIRANGGIITQQFNENNPVGTFLNTMYTLLAEQNFAKFYQKAFVYAEHDLELINGIYFRTMAEYAQRTPLFNSTTYEWIDVKDRDYTANNPLTPLNDLYGAFVKNEIFKVTGVLRLRIKQKYYTRPNRKIIIGSKYPTIALSYEKAIPGIFGSDANYDLVKASIYDDVKLRMLGTSSYNVTYGRYLNSANMNFTDYHHFTGNQTHFSNFSLTRFNLLQYYDFSTNDEYIEAHLEHKFGGLILNKLPLIRKLRLHEMAGVHYLHTKALPQYLEVFFGVEKLGAIRVDFVTGFSSSTKVSAGFRFGLFFD